MADDELQKLLPEEVTTKLQGKGLEAQLRVLVAMLASLLASLADLKNQLAGRDKELRELREKYEEKDVEAKQLKDELVGQSSERKPTSERTPKPKPELSDAEKLAKQKETTKKRKDKREELRSSLPVEHELHCAASACPQCGFEGDLVRLGDDVSSQIEFVAASVKHIIHTIEKRQCPQCKTFFSGDTPARVGDSAIYGPQLHAHVVVSKCADAMPINRLAKRLERAGTPISRSVLTDLWHRAAQLLLPIYDREMELISQSQYVNADETSQPVMDRDKCRRGFMWTFIAGKNIGYIYAPTRSGETASRFLAGTTGRLQVDGYTGYNAVTTPEGRDRDGCWAHVRRYFHKAVDYDADLAERVIGDIRKLYEVEYAAARLGVIGTEHHRRLRQERAGPVLEKLKPWLEKQQPLHGPKSPPGKAIGYALRQWETLQGCLTDPKIRLDNNISERALRVIALGRDSFRWVGNDKAGNNLAVLQTIVATCIAHDINPETYIADVLMRVDTHPASDIDALLPANWSPAR